MLQESTIAEELALQSDSNDAPMTSLSDEALQQVSGGLTPGAINID